jgi:hypothetical protein
MERFCDDCGSHVKGNVSIRLPLSGCSKPGSVEAQSTRPGGGILGARTHQARLGIGPFASLSASEPHPVRVNIN